jgi:hypothetical protein
MIGRRMPGLGCCFGRCRPSCQTISPLALVLANDLSTNVPNTVHAMNEAFDDKMLAYNLHINYCLNCEFFSFAPHPPSHHRLDPHISLTTCEGLRAERLAD